MPDDRNMARPEPFVKSRIIALRKGVELVIERANDGPLLPGLGGGRDGQR
jgi:hypothetical protein